MTKKELIKTIDKIIKEQSDDWFDVDTIECELEENYGIEDADEYYELICERIDKFDEEN